MVKVFECLEGISNAETVNTEFLEIQKVTRGPAEWHNV